jgi:uncharacterized protein YbjT (DUF2867 family)
VGHHVALAIVGVDRPPGNGYFRAKVAQEKLIREGPIPYSIVRATQFFEFVGAIADASTDGDTVRMPLAHFQPIAADDVAAALADVDDAVDGLACGDVGECGGPIEDTSLIPLSAKPRIAPTHFSDWLAAHAS